MIQVLEGDNAIAKNRELMGATDPKKAASGHDPRRFRRSRSTPTRCTAPTRRKRRRSKSRISFRRCAIYRR